MKRCKKAFLSVVTGVKRRAKLSINARSNGKKVHMQRKTEPNTSDQVAANSKKTGHMARNKRNQYKDSATGGQSAHARKNATKNERKRHRKQQANGSNGKKHAQLVRSGGQSAVHMKGKKRNRNERHRHRKQGQKARKRVKRQ